MPIEAMQPIVLVGGRSRRFGRDKLREPWRGSEGGAWLVDQPRLVLAAVFGIAPWAIGTCDPEVAARFERAIPDRAGAGAGPIGGIVTALESAQRSVVVLAGDLPLVDRETVRTLRDAADGAPRAEAIVARTDRLEPCMAIFRLAMLRRLRPVGAVGDLGEERRLTPLHELLRNCDIVEAPIRADAARNLNAIADLDQLPPHSHSI